MLWNNNVKQKNYDFNQFLEDRSFLVLYIGFLCRKLYKERTSDTFEMGNIFSLSGYARPLITKSRSPKCYLSLVTISKKTPLHWLTPSKEFGGKRIQWSKNPAILLDESILVIFSVMLLAAKSNFYKNTRTLYFGPF